MSKEKPNEINIKDHNYNNNEAKDNEEALKNVITSRGQFASLLLLQNTSKSIQINL